MIYVFILVQMNLLQTKFSLTLTVGLNVKYRWFVLANKIISYWICEDYFQNKIINIPIVLQLSLPYAIGIIIFKG